VRHKLSLALLTAIIVIGCLQHAISAGWLPLAISANCVTGILDLSSGCINPGVF
jgi:hypothetical protein